MQNKGNLILAIALSIMIIGLWNYFFPAPQPQIPPDKPAITDKTAVTDNTDQSSVKPDQPIITSREQALANNPRVIIDSAKLKGSINLRGLRFDDLTLSQYTTTSDNTTPITLLSPSNSPNGYVIDLGWLSHNDRLSLPNNKTLWSANKKTLKAGDDVTLTYRADGLIYRVLINLDDNYLFTIKQSVQNLSRTNQDMAFYGLLARFGEVPKSIGIVHQGGLIMMDKKLTEKSYKKIPAQPLQLEGKNGWLGFSDKYWLTALVPHINDENKPNTTTNTLNNIDKKFVSRMGYDETGASGRGRYQMDYVMDYEILPRRQTIEKNIYLFAGPKDTSIINNYVTSKNIEKFDLAIDYGMLYFITKPMAQLLNFLSQQFNSVGWAIIGLTVIVRLLLYPFAQKSFRSMGMMRKLAPKVNELKKRYKTSQEQSQAMMALYKKEGINPLAGCWPMLIQIPVFFALFRVFSISIEFRHAPFFGWISDLSAPDPLGILTLFGLIEWQVPSYLSIVNIGIWPIIMGASIWLQQKFNPPVSDPIQAKIFAYFPFVFTFMLGSSPAGLVIYWSWNNILSIFQQYIINRQLGNPIYNPFESFKKARQR
ncbi:MAG: membrane protein insertase YidC [Alphaproteobacteria bacterium]